MTRLLVVAVFLLGGSRIVEAHGATRATPCTEQAARRVGELYFRLNPITEQMQPDRVMAFVHENSGVLAPDSQTIRCMRLVGSRLVQQGLATFSQRDADAAYAGALSMGASTDQARQVASSINSNSVDAWALGQELTWLAEVLPPAAQGDWTLFAQTGTQVRVSIRQVWPLYQQMTAMDPSMRALLNDAMGQIQDWVEYQVAVLAFWTGR